MVKLQSHYQTALFHHGKFRCNGPNWPTGAGVTGATGPTGSSITGIVDNGNGTITITLSDGTTLHRAIQVLPVQRVQQAQQVPVVVQQGLQAQQALMRFRWCYGSARPCWCQWFGWSNRTTRCHRCYRRRYNQHWR